jgi:RND superfamily putative drug exporter
MSKVTARPPVVERIAGWSATHKKTAVFGWLFLIVAAVVVGGLAGGTPRTSYTPGEAGRAERSLDASGISQVSESVLVQSRSGATFASDADFRQAVSDVATALRAMPDAAKDVRSPLDTTPSAGALVAPDGRAALITFNIAGDKDNDKTTVAKPLDAVARVQQAHPGLLVEEAGSASVNKAIGEVVDSGFQRAEFSSVPVTLVLLLIVFGALVAASIPLLLALTAVVAAISLLSVPGHWLPVSESTSSVVLLIGMAVGVDYSLFYLRREREERLAGRSPAEALRIAAATSGHSILISGLTVMVSLAGLFLTGIDEFSGWAAGTILVVGVAMLGSVTVVPALLAWFGEKVDKGKVPFLGKRRMAARESRFWRVLVRNVVKRPLLWGVPALLALIALLLPAAGMKARDAGPADLTDGSPISQTLLRMEKAFPGGPAPAELIVHGPASVLSGPAMGSALTSMKGMIPTGAQVTTQASADGSYLAVSVPLAGDGADAASVKALTDLRERVLPATLGHVDGITYAVGGHAAGSHDFAAQLHSSTPVVIGFVVLLAFVLMVLTFRSLAIALTAIATNLLSVGASYGVVKLIFQDGRFEKLLGFHAYGGVVSWLPLFMFVILFGLSMDYHVFVLSRIRELRRRGMPTRDAVAGGISSSSGVVSSAALIMVAVFSLFALMPFTPMKMTGVGMAVAVLIDATLVRGVLVPATMSVLGERNWGLPRGLRWVPGSAAERVSGVVSGPRPAAGSAAGSATVRPIGAGLSGTGRHRDPVAPEAAEAAGRY